MALGVVGGLLGYAALTFDPQEVPGLDGAANDSGATVREVSAHRGGAGIRGLRPVRVSPVAVPPKVTVPHQNCTDTPLAGTSRAGPTPRPTRPIAGTERNVAHRPLRITGPDTYLTRTPTGPAPPSMS